MGLPGKCGMKIFFELRLKEFVFIKGHLLCFPLHFFQNIVKLTLLFVCSVFFPFLFIFNLYVLFLFCAELTLFFFQQFFSCPDPGSQIHLTAFQAYRVAFTQRLPFLLHGVSARVQIRHFLLQRKNPLPASLSFFGLCFFFLFSV